MTVKQFTVDAATWTPITAPVDCNTVTLRESTGAVAVKLRSTTTDATTEDTIAAAATRTIGTRPVGSFRSIYPQFGTVIYAQSASGTVTVVATFV